MQLPSAHHTMPLTASSSAGEAAVLPNIVQLVREIALLGEGLVADVEVRFEGVDNFKSLN